MSLSEEATLEESMKELLIKRQRAVIMDPGYDFVLSQIDAFAQGDELAEMFNEYFERKPHDTFAGLRLNPPAGYEFPPDARNPLAVAMAEKASKCVDVIEGPAPPPCSLPCSCITLSGDRRLKFYVKEKPSTYPPTSGPWAVGRIKTLDIGDQVWLFFMDKTGLFDMLAVLLNDFAYGGKYPIPSDEIYGLIMQKLVNEINMGMSSRVKQRTVTSLRSIGIEQQRQEPVKLLEGIVRINRSFISLLLKLCSQLLSFYRTRRAQDVIVGVVSDQPSFAAYAEIIKSLQLLKLAMAPFYYGSNYSNTLKGVVWALASLYILRATRDKYGLPGSFESFAQLIPAAYSNLIKPGQTVETNRWVIYKTIAEKFRDFVLDAGVINTGKESDVKTFVRIEEDRVESIRYGILQATGNIDLADKKWQRDDVELPQKW